MTTKTRATIDDLFRFKGKAELINGEIVHMPATGGMPGFAGDAILMSLWQYTKQTKRGRAIGDNKAFRVHLPHRESFSPDAAYYVGPKPKMKFYEGAPAFAAEVRSEWDYGPAAEREMAAKRADYFAAGTLVVWDVNLLSQDAVKVYRASDPQHPTIFRRGDVAEAEPAVPRWTMPVEELFEF
jgi:Uma2 family endonuclease